MNLRTAALIVLALPAFPQQTTPGDSPTLRTETREVQVDIVATDKKGNYLHDLTQKDIRVWEDNKEQTLTGFSSQAEAATPAAARRHDIVMMFERTNLDGADQAYVKKAATQFIDSNVGDGRRIAIFDFYNTLKMEQNYSDDKVRLGQAVAAIQFSPRKVDPLRDPRLNPTPLEVENNISDLLRSVRQIATGMAHIEGRKSLVLLSGGFKLNQNTIGEMGTTIAACNRNNVAVYVIDVRGLVAAGRARLTLPITGPSLAAVFALNTAFQAGGRGGTSTPAPSQPAPNPVRSEPSPATRAFGSTPTAGSPIQPRGQLGSDDPTREIFGSPLITEHDFTNVQHALHALATGTGGFVIQNSNDLLGGFEKIAKDQSEYIVVNYVPKGEPKPGLCHSLRVKISRPGVEVRARSGYCETAPVNVLSGTPTERELEARLAAGATSNVHATLLAPFFYTSGGAARVHAIVEMPGDAIQLPNNKGVVNIVGIAKNPDGSVAARFSDSVKFDFPDKARGDDFRHKLYRYEKQFEIGPGAYNLQIAFTSGGVNFGRLETPLGVDGFNPTTIMLSGVALARSATPAAATTNSALTENVSLVANGLRINPTGSNHFHRAENCFLYAEVYEPQSTTPPAITAHLALLDENGKMVVRDFGPSTIRAAPTATSGIPVALRVPIADIPAGAYSVSVAATDSAQRKIARLIPIVIED